MSDKPDFRDEAANFGSRDDDDTEGHAAVDRQPEIADNEPPAEREEQDDTAGHLYREEAPGYSGAIKPDPYN